MGRFRVRITMNKNSKEYQDILKELIYCQDRIEQIEKSEYRKDCDLVYWIGRKRGIESCLDVIEKIIVFAKDKK